MEYGTTTTTMAPGSSGWVPIDKLVCKDDMGNKEYCCSDQPNTLNIKFDQDIEAAISGGMIDENALSAEIFSEVISNTNLTLDDILQIQYDGMMAQLILSATIDPDTVMELQMELNSAISNGDVQFTETDATPSPSSATFEDVQFDVDQGKQVPTFTICVDSGKKKSKSSSSSKKSKKGGDDADMGVTPMMDDSEDCIPFVAAADDGKKGKKTKKTKSSKTVKAKTKKDKKGGKGMKLMRFVDNAGTRYTAVSMIVVGVLVVGVAAYRKHTQNEADKIGRAHV